MDSGMDGFDETQSLLSETTRGLAALSGDIASLNFNSHDDASIQSAIRTMEQAIDERARAFANNATVMATAQELKTSYRTRIEDMVREARVEGEGDET